MSPRTTWVSIQGEIYEVCGWDLGFTKWHYGRDLYECQFWELTEISYPHNVFSLNKKISEKSLALLALCVRVGPAPFVATYSDYTKPHQLLP